MHLVSEFHASKLGADLRSGQFLELLFRKRTWLAADQSAKRDGNEDDKLH
jgi:hypothetical protein